MSKKTLVLICILFIIAAGLLYMAYVSMGNKALGPGSGALSPTPTPYAQSVLMLAASTTTPNTVDVLIQSNENQVTAAQFVIQYDPKVMTVTGITPGDFFTTPVIFPQTIDNKTGRLSYALGITPTGDAKQGNGVIAHITYTPLVTGQTATLSFTPETLVTAVGYKDSVLKTTQPTTITLGSTPTQ